MKIFILLVVVAAEVFSTELNPLSDEFINYINSKQSTWAAGRNFDENTSMQKIRKLLGAKKIDPSRKVPKKFFHPEDSDIPESFDPREQWPECKDVIGQIADQSDCASCWAVSVASVITDRRCIHSKGQLKIPVSALDLLSCTNEVEVEGCLGGYADFAWDSWYANGVVTGGPYNSSQGCRPYSMEPCEHHVNGSRKPCPELGYVSPPCIKQCDDPSLIYENELTFGIDEPNWFKGEANIQRELLTNGPVTATFEIYTDFLSYKSGVYQHTAGGVLDVHSARLIGWGVENGTKYWLVANSWNEDWGENGYIKILRGNGEVGIEGEILASMPKL